jgi:hypothetical protein
VKEEKIVHWTFSSTGGWGCLTYYEYQGGLAGLIFFLIKILGYLFDWFKLKRCWRQIPKQRKNEDEGARPHQWLPNTEQKPLNSLM